MEEPRITVVVADDQPLVRDGLRAVLRADRQIEVVGEAADGADAVEVARRVRPDVVLMDIRMPVLDGLEAARRLLDDPQPPRVVMITTFDLDEHLFAAVRAGCSGFVLKDAPRDEIVAAVRAAASGDALITPALTRRLIEEFARTAPAAGNGAESERLADLTEREHEVLALLARGLSNAEISERLVVAHGTVKTHVGRILMKCGLRDRAQAVVLAYEAGVVRPGE